MRNGIFQRLLITYILVVAIIIGLLSLSISQSLKAYFFQAKQRELIGIGRQVETQLIRFRRGDITKQELTGQVNTIGHAANCRIIIIDSNNPETGLLKSGLGNEFKVLLERIFRGETIVKRQQFAEEINTFVMAVGIPANPGEGRKGAILLFSPVYEVNSALNEVYKIIWITALISLTVGLALVWTTSRRISGPIVNLSEMAEQIAKGQNVDDIPAERSGEIGRMVASFNSMKNQLARTERMRREFIAGVSHELRTPLTSIRGFIQGILDGVIQPDQQAKYLKLAFAETTRLARLTSDLLELTKLEAGAVRLNKRRFILKELIEESVLSAHRSPEQRDVTPEIRVIPPDLSLEGDPDRLKQVFLNLLTNAYKYTPEGGNIKVEAWSEGEKIIIRIIDTGIGIPAEELPLIFEKFHRVDKSRNSSAGGSGLGLSIVKNLVELHGGQITVESTEGTGTCFQINLPNN